MTIDMLITITLMMFLMDVPNSGTVPSSAVTSQSAPAGQGDSESLPSPTMDREAVQRLAEQAQQIADRLGNRQLSQETIDQQRQLFATMKAFVPNSQTDTSSQEQAPGDAQNETSNSENAKPPKPSVGNSSGQAETPPAKRNTASTPVSVPATRGELIDTIWGHLPERERDELARTYQEHSIPGYEGRVRDYFTQLAKKVANSPSITSPDAALEETDTTDRP